MLATLFSFATTKMKPLTTLTTLFYFPPIKIPYLAKRNELFSFITIIKIKSLTTLNKLFCFVTTIKKNSDRVKYSVLLQYYYHDLSECATPFYFNAVKMIYLTTLTAIFYFATIKKISRTALTALFYFSTIKVAFLTRLTTLFHFTTIKMKSLITPTMLFYFAIKWSFWLCSLPYYISLLLK